MLTIQAGDFVALKHGQVCPPFECGKRLGPVMQVYPYQIVTGGITSNVLALTFDGETGFPYNQFVLLERPVIPGTTATPA